MSCFRFSSFALICFCLLLVSCKSAYRSPVAEIDEPRFLDTDRIHRVNEGETLYAIAWIYDLDFLHIARVNRLSSPYTIRPGQILNVDPRAQAPAPTTSKPTSTASTTSPPRQRSAGRTGSAPATEPVQVNPVNINTGPVSWGWPATGVVIGQFSASSVDNKGINIAGQQGDSVMAAADGEVVYAGSGLLRYGDLLIIKHNDQFLSAYAHNSALLVKEGERVRRGQKIAELGSTGVDRNMLHFEIRQEGKPVDPMRYLPPKS